MTLQDILNIALTVIGSIGASSGILFGLSSWLGKVWATRLMDKERHRHDLELAELRSKLEQSNHRSIEGFKTDLTIFKEKHLKGFNDKIQTYRLMVDIVAEILGYLDTHALTGHKMSEERFEILNKARLRVYGYLGMIAPQKVMDAQDNMFDYLIQVAHGNQPYVWEKVRALALELINEVRRDIGIDSNPIIYSGSL